jgi:hypothetical protein
LKGLTLQNTGDFSMWWWRGLGNIWVPVWNNRIKSHET